MKPLEADNILRSGEVAAYLKINASTLAKWRQKRTGPTFHRLGDRIVYYIREELDAWRAECDARDALRRRKSAEAKR